MRANIRRSANEPLVGVDDIDISPQDGPARLEADGVPSSDGNEFIGANNILGDEATDERRNRSVAISASSVGALPDPRGRGAMELNGNGHENALQQMMLMLKRIVLAASPMGHVVLLASFREMFF